MNKLYSLFLFILFSVFTVNAESLGIKNLSANQEFKVLVYENSDSTLLTFGKNVNNRGILGDSWKAIKGAYRNTALGTVSSVSADLLSAGIGIVVEALRDKKGDRIQQVAKDCKYTKRLPMQQQITDFYASTSTRGAMDLDSIVFDGFGCQQFLNFTHPETGKLEKFLVFDLKCSLRRDNQGKDRMLHHSKFEVVVDRLFFNPYLCNIPNDSLNIANVGLRTPFSFESRKNLKFNVNAKITSSWMNEAIQVVNDQLLGEFNITANIPDSLAVENGDWNHGYFVYIRPTASNIKRYNLSDAQIETMKQREKLIDVKGESFLVPRSFIGYEDAKKLHRIWGTGQYKIDMTINESCDINYEYYLKPAESTNMVASRGLNSPLNMKGRKWNRYWTEEWNKIKKRKGNRNIFQSIWADLKMTYGNNRWVYTVLDPVATVILAQENAALTKWTDDWMKLGNSVSSANSTNKASQGQAPSKK